MMRGMLFSTNPARIGRFDCVPVTVRDLVVENKYPLSRQTRDELPTLAIGNAWVGL